MNSPSRSRLESTANENDPLSLSHLPPSQEESQQTSYENETLDASIHYSVTEDPQNILFEELRKEQYPLTVKFLMWQDSNLGNYIEFKIRVTYHEGHETPGIRTSLTSPHQSIEAPVNPHATSGSAQAENSWIVYKRYSNFIDLHETLSGYFKAEGLRAPRLPPKIANERNS